MLVVENHQLKREFLQSAGLPTMRALIPHLFPGSKAKARSKDELLERLPPEPWNIDVQGFRRAMWELASAEVGAMHLGIMSAPELDRQNAANILDPAHSRWQARIKQAASVETNAIIDSRVQKQGRDVLLEILHLGETEAEIYEEQASYNDVVGGTPYHFKAYRIARVPVISAVQIDTAAPFVAVATFPIHRSANPTREVLGLQPLLEDELGVPFPPVAGIAEGIRNLWGTNIEARSYEVEEGDGTRAHIRRARGTQNNSSIEMENGLRSWTLRSGSLVYTPADIPFRVDTRKAVFSFRTRCLRKDAFGVIHTIIGAS